MERPWGSVFTEHLEALFEVTVNAALGEMHSQNDMFVPSLHVIKHKFLALLGS